MNSKKCPLGLHSWKVTKRDPLGFPLKGVCQKCGKVER